MYAVWYVLGGFIIFSFQFGTCEIYSATVHFNQVVESESTVINALANYIAEETQKLNLLSRYLKAYQKEHKKCSDDVEDCVNHPINVYFLIKRLTEERAKIESVIKTNISQEYFSKIASLELPTDKDLIGARDGLIRLQHVYKFDITKFTKGQLASIKSKSQLRASDCFEIGKQCLDTGDFNEAQIWLKEAYEKLDRKPNSINRKGRILEYLSQAAYREGNTSLALDFINKLLDVLPENQEAIKAKEVYKKVPVNEKLKYVIKNIDPIHNGTNSPGELSKLYKQMCENKEQFSVRNASELKCRYVNNKNPYLFIAPFRMEEISLYPIKIALYHNILSDKEIELIKNLSIPQLTRANVTNAFTNQGGASTTRVGKVNWLYEKHHQYIDVFLRRISHLTGLNLSSAEAFQVSNYGIGGHFEPHSDYFQKEAIPDVYDGEDGLGNRIATVLFYFDNAMQGGATVFPYANVTITPVKGAAALWYNLKLSGETDVYTTHASCPLIAGTKWIMTKWIHERHQEFLRPCGLSPNATEGIGKGYVF